MLMSSFAMVVCAFLAVVINAAYKPLRTAPRISLITPSYLLLSTGGPASALIITIRARAGGGTS
jgi:hypothetical protein